jgi:hypothetical protein
MDGECGTHNYNVVVRKLEEKRPLWRPRRKREDNIKTGVGLNRIHLHQGRVKWQALVNIVMKL